ncbi:MAG: Nif3-like dinuclear metal center hexameric protein [Planctomycetota bacterium]
MTQVQDICDFLESFAPTALAEDWDNVGLIVGDPAVEATKIMTCLTITPESADEAITRGASLIVSHHPLPFRPLKRITTEQTPSRLIWDLIRAGVSIYSPHTAFDSAPDGINQMFGQRLGLSDIQPLVAADPETPSIGAGRHGQLENELTLASFADNVKQTFGLGSVKICGSSDFQVRRVGVACGSGGSFLGHAIAAGCDTFVTGETTFHTCLEAAAQNVALVLTGHYASERFAVESLATTLATRFPGCEVWASQKESDPVQIV